MTSEIHLRIIRKNDAQRIALLANDRELSLCLRDSFPFPYTLKDAYNFMQLAKACDPPEHFAICKGTVLVGLIGLHPMRAELKGCAELGYWLGREYWGKGFATQAVRLILSMADDMIELRRVEASVYASNPASYRVLEKCGFLREAVLKMRIVKEGRIDDEIRFVYFPRSG